MVGASAPLSFGIINQNFRNIALPMKNRKSHQEFYNYFSIRTFVQHLRTFVHSFRAASPASLHRSYSVLKKI